MPKKKTVQESMQIGAVHIDGKREYTVIRDFVNKYSGKHCPKGSRIFLSDDRAATLTELGCVALVPSRI